MKVRLKTAYANSERAASAGQVIEVGEDEARDLVAGGYAVEYVEPPVAAGEAPGNEGTDDSAAVIAEYEEKLKKLQRSKGSPEALKAAEEALTAAEAERDAWRQVLVDQMTAAGVEGAGEATVEQATEWLLGLPKESSGGAEAVAETAALQGGPETATAGPQA